MAAVLGSLDARVFTTGIDEHSHRLRAAVVWEMQWLGLTLSEVANVNDAPCISRDGALPVLIVPTDQEWMIEQHLLDMSAA